MDKLPSRSRLIVIPLALKRALVGAAHGIRKPHKSRPDEKLKQFAVIINSVG